MVNRVDLQNELLELCPNVYFTPPSSIRLTYPCIIYRKASKDKLYSNDSIYKNQQVYELTVIANNPTSDLDDLVENKFRYCTINSYATVDNLKHTYLTLYY